MRKKLKWGFDIPYLTSSLSSIYHFYIESSVFHGILLGSLGIGIGTHIAVFINKDHEKKENELNNQINELKKQITAITETSNNIIKLVNSELKLIEDYEKLLHVIGEIIDHSNENNNNLLIMNLSASFGYYLTYDADTVLKDKHEEITSDHVNDRNKTIKKITCDEYFSWHHDLLLKQEANYSKLRAVANNLRKLRKSNSNIKADVIYLTLEPGTGSKEDPYRNEYLDSSLSAAKVCFFDDKNSDNLFDHVGENQLNGINKLFLLPKSEITDNNNPTEDFISHLTEKQKIHIKEMETSGATVCCLTRIPFQMYLSIPVEESEHKKGKGVFMIVNQYTLSKSNYVAAFETEDHELLGALKTIFNNVKSSH